MFLATSVLYYRIFRNYFDLGIDMKICNGIPNFIHQ